MTDLWQLTLADAARRLRARELSPVELTEATLARAVAVDEHIGAFEALTADDALEAARRAEAEIGRGEWRGPLHGVPVTVKDIFDVAGLPTTASSRVPSGQAARADAAAVDLLRRAGAIIIGKTRTHEFAFGFTTPGTRNPWDEERIAGGSSGGAAAAVVAGAGALGLGSDTAGSIRNPAAQCGAVGLKPTFGAISRTGMIPLSRSLDHAGVIGRTVVDVAHAFAALAGYDERDPASVPVRPLDLGAALDLGVDGVRIGVPVDHLGGRIAADVAAAADDAVRILRSLGTDVRPVELPLAEHALAIGFGIILPEAAELHASDLRRYADRYTDETRMLLEAGSLIGAVDYIRATRARALLKSAWQQMFVDSDIDVIVTPTVPVTAAATSQSGYTWPDGTHEDLVAPVARATLPANLTGLPALSVPHGPDTHLPIGIQITGRPFDEATVLRVGHALQEAAGLRRPPAVLPERSHSAVRAPETR